jgi:GT2 family glycosyltransferase
MGPLLVRRSWFEHLGQFNLNFSCAGDPGIGFDFEYSVRMWKEGGRVGLYDPLWNYHIHSSTTSKSLSKVGTHARTSIIINILMPVKQNSFTHLRVLLVLTDRSILGTPAKE